MSVRISGVRATLKETDREFNQQIATQLRSTALSAYADLVRTTPVDTGRARNSWTVSWDLPVIINSLNSTSRGARLSPRTVPTVVWFANGVDYILPLNMGHSKQAPTRFIEQAIIRNIPGADLSSLI